LKVPRGAPEYLYFVRARILLTVLPLLAKTQKKIAGFKGKGLKFPGRVSRDAEDFITGLLDLDAEKRMGLDEVLVHPWIKRHVEKSSQSGVRSFSTMLERAA
jgi:serine/threonine protein kinase